MSHYYKQAVYLFSCLCVVLFGGCSTSQQMARKLQHAFRNSEVMGKYHVGFAIADLQNDKVIYSKNGDKYFTPASNTKLFTFYAALKMLPDSIPSLRYIERGDSLIFWGTGDPSFLQTALKGTRSFDFLKSSVKKLFFAKGRYTGNFYGNGWQWDDYNDYYQAEINELPMMDNLVDFRIKNGKIIVFPPFFEHYLSRDSSVMGTEFNIKRDFLSNQFYYSGPIPQSNYHQQIPFKINTELSLLLLSDTLKKKVEWINKTIPEDAKTIYNLKTDAVLKQMMLPSDNFIAEQLLLVCSNQISGELNTEKTIKYIEKNYLKELPDPPSWVDGSGLSRGNLFTPRDIIVLLRLIYKEVNNRERLFSLLPSGGKSGTLRNAYPATENPFVYGKTGTLSNNHNQSGYVLTKKGKIYIYSFMNNNFVLPTSEVRKEMTRIVTYIHENF
ncbi:D-alanyl-D-alanine carboxypeptidase/D-alanyl-D-alanine-endopeptidase (penicillin-binding protein 4) [Pedobacter nutrimenti]|uniref:D-alanyl-D-alanine carboxypeptidase/D-alanyl-D-alanine-endopeptidase (Penicillin-binding protein 4) n=2 Tax=Pedobacter nutrimenti TaxID=1241337 RepID=A0A318UII4_9SPHI|nr:D-alanyl-D-alanine carboxypeptidase/D-alanyl-D-alanine-endopeptidase (penicillin-binding protein 4) [Pedobacter nutrimenti]